MSPSGMPFTSFERGSLLGLEFTSKALLAGTESQRSFCLHPPHPCAEIIILHHHTQNLPRASANRTQAPILTRQALSGLSFSPSPRLPSSKTTSVNAQRVLSVDRDGQSYSAKFLPRLKQSRRELTHLLITT